VLLVLAGAVISSLVWVLMPTKDRIGALEAELAIAREEADGARQREIEAQLADLKRELERKRRLPAQRPEKSPFEATTFLILFAVTALLPLAILVWVFRTLRRGQRIWRCPVCKNLAPFLAPCGSCGCSTPGLLRFMGFCAIALGVVVVAALFILAVWAVVRFAEELPSEEQREPPATSSRPVCPGEERNGVGHERRCVSFRVAGFRLRRKNGDSTRPGSSLSFLVSSWP